MDTIVYFLKRLHTNTGPYLYLNMTGMVLISMLEGVSILLLVPLLSMSGLFETATYSFFNLFDFLKDMSQIGALSVILGIYVLLIVGQSFVKRLVMLGSSRIHQSFMLNLRIDTFQQLLQANWSFYLKRRKADFVNSLTSEIGRVSGGMNTILSLATSLLFTLVQLVLAFWLSPQLTLLVLTGGIAISLFSRRFIRRSEAIGQTTIQLSKEYHAGLMDQLNGIKDIKSNALEQNRLEWISSVDRKLMQEQYNIVKVKSASQLFYQVSAGILIAVFVMIAVVMFQARMDQMLLIIVIFSRLWPRFNMIQSSLEGLANSLPAFRSIMNLHKESKEANEIHIGDPSYRNVMPLGINDSLECHQVSFRYDINDDAYALRDISLRIAANEMTAIVGRSGAGKSTLIDMLMGLILPEEGKILVDDVPLTRDNLMNFRRSISYVPQDPFLFHGSIKDNMLLVKTDASDTEIWEALEFAASAEFVKRLPQGLNTIIGDRGIRLSGGERQRLVLARAILRKPSILVLDEATSALDSENESKIQEALEKLKGRITIIVIAHRLSTIQNADQVIVMDQGIIVQNGSFSRLAQEKNSLLSHFLEQQTIAVTN